MAKANKEAVRKDYEAGMSQRALALKYGISKSCVAKWALADGWAKYGQSGRVPTAGAEELPELKTPHEFEIVRAYAHRLLDRVGETLDSPKPIAPRDLRSISSTLLDVRQLLNALSPIEAEEQRLRIEGLRKQAEESARMQASVTVQFVDTEEAEL